MASNDDWGSLNEEEIIRLSQKKGPAKHYTDTRWNKHLQTMEVR